MVPAAAVGLDFVIVVAAAAADVADVGVVVPGAEDLGLGSRLMPFVWAPCDGDGDGALRAGTVLVALAPLVRDSADPLNDDGLDV